MAFANTTSQRQPSLSLPDQPSLAVRLYARYQAWIGFALAAVAIAVGWLGSDNRNLNAESGLGYFLGFMSVSCMMILLIYPLRKRIRMLRFLGKVKDWFRTHMIMGVLATVTALYHCNFELGSLNSRIALFSALLVAGSGLIGRLIYSKIHHGLYGRKATLKELLADVKLTAPAGSQAGTFIPELMKRIATFDRQVLVPPKGMLDSMVLPLRLWIQTRRAGWQLSKFVRNRLLVEAMQSQVVAQHRKKLERVTRRYIKEHLRHVRRVAEFTAYERLFSLWHVVHLPFFYLLIISTAVHVAAVHLY